MKIVDDNEEAARLPEKERKQMKGIFSRVLDREGSRIKNFVQPLLMAAPKKGLSQCLKELGRKG